MKHALLIGINDYSQADPSRRADLEGCVNDVNLMATVLEDDLGFPPERTYVLRNAQATAEAIRGHLDALASDAAARERFGVAPVRPGDVVAFYYSGHGSYEEDPERPGRHRYETLVPYDSGRPPQRENRDLRDAEIDDWVARMNALGSETEPVEVALLFDCCHSGGVARAGEGIAAPVHSLPAATPTMIDALGDALQIPGNRSFRGAPARLAGDSPPTLRGTRGAAGWIGREQRATVIAACRFDELSRERAFRWSARNTQRHGALTFNLASALIEMPGATWREVFDQTAARVTAKVPDQHPQIAGRADGLVFGIREVRAERHLTITETLSGSPPRYRLSGGAAHGAVPGSRWAVRPASSRRDGKEPPLVRVEVEAGTVTATSCLARPVAEPGARSIAAAVEVGQRAFLIDPALPEPMPVSFEGLPPEALGDDPVAKRDDRKRLLRLVAELEASPLLRPFDAETESDEQAEDGRAHVRLRRRGEPSAIWWEAVSSEDGAGNGRLLVRRRRDGTAAHLRLVEDLEAWVRYRHLLALGNPRSPLAGRVELRVLRRAAGSDEAVPAIADGGDALPVFRPGERADFEIRYRADRERADEAEPLWVHLIELSPDLAISLLVPYRHHAAYRPGGVELRPGQTLRVRDYLAAGDERLTATVRDGLPFRPPPADAEWALAAGEDPSVRLTVLRLLVTREPADFDFLEQGAVRRGEANGLRRPFADLADRFAGRLDGRPRRGEQPAEAPALDWAASTVRVGIGS